MGNVCGKIFRGVSDRPPKSSSPHDLVISLDSFSLQSDHPSHSNLSLFDHNPSLGVDLPPPLHKEAIRTDDFFFNVAPDHAFPDSILGHQTERVEKVYRMDKKLGQGQFGTTFLCFERSTDKEYACKTIPKRNLVTTEAVNDVKREVAIMHHLSGCPNIVGIKGAYEDRHAVHIVMEVCTGGELFDRIIAKGHYSERKAAELTKIIVGVVERLHSLGVMHRDLKPENFLFSNEEEDAPLKATDFGLSVFFKPGDIFQDVVGSPYYVAPEVLRRHYGPEIDVWSAGIITYILLSGVPPFWAETDRGIFEAVLRCNIDFDSDPWPVISESAKDLVRKMLTPDPKKRITAFEVLCHPWIATDGVAPDRPLDSAVFTRLKQFSAMNRFKRMALRMIAESMSEEEIAGLKEMFRMMDIDNSGTITYEELKHGLKEFGSNLKDDEIRELMNAADFDKNGMIDYGEFLAATLHMNKIEKEGLLHTAFARFDKDKNGYISVDELRQAFREYNMGEECIMETMHDVDTNNDGRIDYNEFAAMMRKGNGGVGKRSHHNLSSCNNNRSSSKNDAPIFQHLTQAAKLNI